MNSEVRDYAIFIIAQVLRIAFSTVAMGVLARFLGPDGLGRWAMITAAATLMHLLFLNWMQQDPFVKYGREEFVTSGRLAKAWSARGPILVGGFILACLLLTKSPGAWTHAVFFLSPTEQWLALAFLVSLMVSVELQSVLQITARMRALALVPVWIAAGSAIYYGGLYTMALPHYRLGTALLGTVAITSTAWLCGGAFSAALKSIRWAPWDRSLAKQMIVFAWPMLPAALLGYGVNWGNQVILRHALSIRDVGLYQSAFQVHNMIMAFAVPLTTIILPKLIGRQLEDPTATARYVRTIAPTIFGLWLVALIPLVAALPLVFFIVFGAKYASAIPVLIAFLVATPLCALGQLYTVLFTVHARLSKVLVISAIMVFINLGLAWLILPRATPRHFAQVFSLAFAVGQYLMCIYHHRALAQPAGKIHTLLAVLLFFSIPQAFITPFVFRLLWGAFGLALLVMAFRSFSLLDREILSRLFPERPAGLRQGVLDLLAPERNA